jgi:hypothetical protein
MLGYGGMWGGMGMAWFGLIWLLVCVALMLGPPH